MEWLLALINTLIGSEVAWGVIIAMIIGKLVPNSVIKKTGYWVGTFLTLFLSKFNWWINIEKWVIDGIAVFVTSFIDGLRSDNSPNVNDTNPVDDVTG